MYLGIDLSLRSTGLVYIGKDKIQYKLVTSDSKKLNDEELIIYNTNEICDFIAKHQPKYIGLEGLSFGSTSSSKDILAGNFWHLRVEILQQFSINVDIIPVLTWRSKLFNKEERKQLKENDAKVKLLKKELLKSSKEDKKHILAENEELILKSNIKYVTWEKLPKDLQEEFKTIGFTKGGFDLTDSYFIADYMRTKYGKI